MTRLLPLLFILLVCSCATRKERRCHRAAKKVEKASELCPAAFGVDTLHLFDTVYVDGVQVTDTFTVHELDTVTIEKERLRVQVVRRFDTLYVDAACDPDTIVTYRTIEVPAVDLRELDPGVAPWYRTAFWVLAVLIVVEMGITAILRR